VCSVHIICVLLPNANVPREDFERQVESEKPPTITVLARAGNCIACHSAPEAAVFAGGRVKVR